MLRSILILLFILTFSCNHVAKRSNNSDIKEIVTIYTYPMWLSNMEQRVLRDSTVTYVDTRDFYNRKYHIYALNDSVEVWYSYAIESDSLFLDNVYCPNLDTMYLQYENEMIALTISYYNEEHVSDDEMYVYWNSDYGLVALYDCWSILILYDKETMKGFAKDTFYNYVINRLKENKRCMFEGLDCLPYP